MTYYQLAIAHLATVAPAFVLGTYLMLNRKGTPQHRQLGKLYMLLMLITTCLSLLMSAEVGPQFLGHFGYIHILSAITLVCVPTAYYAARTGKINLHKWNMISLYIGGLLIAGGFTFMPGRLLHGWIFG